MLAQCTGDGYPRFSREGATTNTRAMSMFLESRRAVVSRNGKTTDAYGDRPARRGRRRDDPSTTTPDRRCNRCFRGAIIFQITSPPRAACCWRERSIRHRPPYIRPDLVSVTGHLPNPRTSSPDACPSNPRKPQCRNILEL